MFWICMMSNNDPHSPGSPYITIQIILYHSMCLVPGSCLAKLLRHQLDVPLIEEIIRLFLSESNIPSYFCCIDFEDFHFYVMNRFSISIFCWTIVQHSVQCKVSIYGNRDFVCLMYSQLSSEDAWPVLCTVFAQILLQNFQHDLFDLS